MTKPIKSKTIFIFNTVITSALQLLFILTRDINIVFIYVYAMTAINL